MHVTIATIIHLFNRIFEKNVDIQCYVQTIYRLDQILGKQGSKAKDVYASKISLASRVVKVERSVSKKKKTLVLK